MADRVQMRAAPKMELLQILNKILRTKNEIRDIVGENDNIARYDIAIHNKLAELYNAAWKQAFHDRYYTLAGYERWVDGPIDIWDYNVDAKYYDKYDTEELTDIMKDVLNYRLQIKDELNEYLNDTVQDDFENYPTYLNGLLNRVAELGTTAGLTSADEVYEASSTVENPTITYSGNVFILSSTQADAAIYFKLGEDGITTLYKNQVIISEPCTIYYWAKVGQAISLPQTYDATISENGVNAFVFPPTVYQEDNMIYLQSSTNNATIHYKIDDGEWQIYYGVILVNNNMNSITAMATRNGEYSKYNVYEISHEADIDQFRPANVNCEFNPIEGGAEIVLSCPTQGARIFYAIDEADGYYREYTQPVNEMNTHFILYTYALKDGYTSKMRLIYRYDEAYDPTIPEKVQFIEEGNKITLYTTTPGATIFYRINSIGSYVQSNSSVVELEFTEKTYIDAYAIKDDKLGEFTSYIFYPNNTSGSKPAKPTIIQDGNEVTIASNFTVKYTTDTTDPRMYGIIYNTAKGITITESTIIKAVAEYDGKFSDVASKSCIYNDLQGGASGSDDNTETTDGTNTTELFFMDNWFAVTGITSISYNGTTLKYAAAGDTYWKQSKSSKITGLDSQVKYYFKGTLFNISEFEGSAVISGDMSSLKGETLKNNNATYYQMFFNTKNLVNATGLDFSYLTEIPYNFMYGTFMLCTDLQEAGFTIPAATIPNYGLYKTFEGCTNMRVGPVLNVNNIFEYGMYGTFNECNKLESTYKFDITYVDKYGLTECFRNCASLTNVQINTSTNVPGQYAYARMFYGCRSLEDMSSSSFVHSGTYQYCCLSMFEGCTNLKYTFDLYPTSISGGCYQRMFYGCSSLLSAPNIYGTNVADDCYNSMFEGCESIVKAPDLEVTQLTGGYRCYERMFNGCSSLNHIKALFITDPTLSNYYTDSWVEGVAEHGTFIANNEALWTIKDNAEGKNAIPVGWTVIGGDTRGRIQRIWSQDGMIYIKASNSDTIYWTHELEEVPVYAELRNKYTGPFKIPNWQGTIYAACYKEEEDIWGPMESYEIDNSAWPALVIVQRSGQIRITSIYGDDFYFDNIKYRICYQDTGTLIKDWVYYTGPFTIDRDCRIDAEGYMWGIRVTEIHKNVFYETTSPVIEFTKRWNLDQTSIIDIWCNISYPNTNVLKGLYYKVNDNNDDDPDTAPESWHECRDSVAFKITQYIDETHEYVTITAVAKVDHTGVEVWSPQNIQIMYADSSEQLSIPVFIQLPSSNNAILEYNEERYSTWNDLDVVIEYKYNIGGAVQQYVNILDLKDAGYVTSSTISLYARARCGNVRTDWFLYQLYFDTSYLHFDVDDPEIYAVLVNGKIMIYMSNNSSYSNNYTFYNYIRIEILGTDAVGVGSIGNSGCYAGYVLYNNPIELYSHITKFQIFGQSRYNNDYSNEVSSRIYDIKTDFGIVWDERPAPTVTVDPKTHVITITTSTYDVIPQIKVLDTVWGPGQVNEHIYDDYSLVTNYTFGKKSNYVYSGTLSQYLASGTLYVRYTAENITSTDTIVEYVNSDVYGVVAPTVTVTWLENAGVYSLVLTNEVNDGVTLKYRMENCVWAPSVANTARAYKYRDPQVAELYRNDIDVMLYEADIIGITNYDPHEENMNVESEPYHFVNEHIPHALPPIITFKKVSGTWNIFIDIPKENDSVYPEQYTPVAYWKLKEGTGVWDPQYYYTNIYDDFQLYNRNGMSLNMYLYQGTFEAFASLEGDTTETVEAEFDSGIVIENTPPTISLTATENTEYPDQSFYTVTLTNNATTDTYPRFKWKLIDIEINNNTSVGYSASRYMKTSGDCYVIDASTSNSTMIESMKKMQFFIGTDVKKATIQCYCTNETNNSTNSQGTRTAISTYEFTNRFVTE